MFDHAKADHGQSQRSATQEGHGLTETTDLLHQSEDETN